MNAAGDLCPECGTPRLTVATRSAWAGRRRVGVQAAAVVAALLLVAWKNYEAWPVLPAASRVPRSGGFAFFLPAARVTWAEVEKYESGARRDGRLLGAFAHEDAFDSQEIVVAFVPPKGGTQEHHRYGWPVMWLLYRYEAVYEDVYARAFPRAWGAGGLRDGWHRWTHIRNRARAGVSERRVFYPLNLCGAGLVLIGSAYAGVATRCVSRRIPPGCCSIAGGERLRRLFPLAFLGTAVAVVGALSSHPGVTRGRMDAHSRLQPARFPRVTIGELRGKRGDPDAEAWLAHRILDAVDRDSVDPRLVLATSWRSPFGWSHASASGGWPDGLLYRQHVSVSPDTEPPLVGRSGADWIISTDRISVTRWMPGPLEAKVTLEVKLGPLSRLVFGLWLVWVVSGAGPRVLAVLHGRRQRRLAAAGCCVVCGYELVLSAPEPDHR